MSTSASENQENNSEISNTDVANPIQTTVFNFDELNTVVESSPNSDSVNDNRNDYERIFQLETSPGNHIFQTVIMKVLIVKFRAVQQTMLCTRCFLQKTTTTAVALCNITRATSFTVAKRN